MEEVADRHRHGECLWAWIRRRGCTGVKPRSWAYSVEWKLAVSTSFPCGVKLAEPFLSGEESGLRSLRNSPRASCKSQISQWNQKCTPRRWISQSLSINLLISSCWSHCSLLLSLKKKLRSLVKSTVSKRSVNPQNKIYWTNLTPLKQ